MVIDEDHLAAPPHQTQHRFHDLHFHVVGHFVKQKEASYRVKFPSFRVNRIAACHVYLRQICELLPSQGDLERSNVANIETAMPTDLLGELTGEAAIDRGRLKDAITRLHRSQDIPDQQLRVSPENGLNHDLPVQQSSEPGREIRPSIDVAEIVGNRSLGQL